LKDILILLAHPKLEDSRINNALLEAAKTLPNVRVHDLYDMYPDFNIDVVYEQEILFGHEVVIWQHPFYWYSAPPILKQWIDLVLEYNWAYGPNAFALREKTILNALTAGGSREVYCAEGRNHYTVSEFLRPFEQTARLCGMNYLPPFSVMGANKIKGDQIRQCQEEYINLLKWLSTSEADVIAKDSCQFINDLDIVKKGGQS